MSIQQNLQTLKKTLLPDVTLVAVSKTKPIEDLKEAYAVGQRVFGENKVQELCLKEEELPKDIEWHMIGHLQSNKVKYIAPFVSLIHGVDKPKLLSEISKQGLKYDRQIKCLIQVYVGDEDTKFGFDPAEVLALLSSLTFEKDFPGLQVVGLMAMATNTEDDLQRGREFTEVKQLFDSLSQSVISSNIKMEILSMGMSGDYVIAMDCGSNMVRVGSSIFGSRNYNI